MSGIYVAQEVIRRREFSGYAFAHDLVGCKTYDNYYIKEELILIVGNEEYGFLYLDGNKKCNVLNLSADDINNNFEGVHSCEGCDKSTSLNGSDCEEKIDPTEQVIGITNIVKINEFTKCNDVSSSIKHVEEYNRQLKNKYILIKNKTLSKKK